MIEVNIIASGVVNEFEAGERVASSQPRKVGPGHPPVEYQFKKGQSGNLKGRPRKSNLQAFAEAMAKVLDQKVILKGKGGDEEIDAREAILRRLVKDAISEGGKPAMYLIAVAERLEKYAPVETQKVLTADQERQLLVDFVNRLGLSPDAAMEALRQQGLVTDQEADDDDQGDDTSSGGDQSP